MSLLNCFEFLSFTSISIMLSKQFQKYIVLSLLVKNYCDWRAGEQVGVNADDGHDDCKECDNVTKGDQEKIS